MTVETLSLGDTKEEVITELERTLALPVHSEVPTIPVSANPDEAPLPPTVSLPGGPPAEPKTNASAIERMREMFGGEYDFGNVSRFALQAKIVDLAKALSAAEVTTYHKMAPLVAAIAAWRHRFHVKYEEVAELLAEAMPNLIGNRLLKQDAKGPRPAEVETTGQSPSRQFATRYVRLADWTNARLYGTWKKQDLPGVDSVAIMGKVYQTPVDALMDGHSPNRVDMAWKWALGRKPQTDNTGIPEAVSQKYAEDNVKDWALTILVTDPKIVDTEGRPIGTKRSKVAVVDHRDATLGAILGFLRVAMDRGYKYSSDDVSTIIEMAEVCVVPAPETPAPTD